MLKEGNGFLRGAEFEVIHSDNYAGAEQVRPFVQCLCEVAHRGVIFEHALVGEAEVDFGFD